MLQSVIQCLYFLFAFTNLAVKFITVSLQLFLFLAGFDNIIRLAVLTGCLNLARA
jgi:hypothetical protein